MSKHAQNKLRTSEQRQMRPALTPEARENQMISLAMDLVEQRLRDGSASSAETTHFLKLASSKERLEMEVMQKQKELLEAKKEDLDSNKRIEALYSEAMKAMRTYSGQTSDNYDDFNKGDK